ncbi:MAG: hypothetical protein IV085_09920 [Thiobacillus sp.]|nr:hypothetical protein [Thiobacillus sp.]
MTSRPHPFRSNKLLAALVILISLVLSGLGVQYIVEQLAPETHGRFGVAGPFFGAAAQQVGLGMVLLGLLPLSVFARTAKGAALFGSLVLAAVVANILVGRALWQ